jgi:antitoxin component YwqK of YwqJK toxin-antitoxin module
MSTVLVLLALSASDDDLRGLKIPPDAVERPDAWRATGKVGAMITKKREYFVDGALVGQRLFYENGQLADEKLYRDAKLHGIWRQYAPNGKLVGERPYRDGQMDGTFRFWDENGKLVRESVMTKGTGLLREYGGETSRSLDAETRYVDGKKEGLSTEWGRFQGCEGYGYSIAEYKDGQLDGWEHTRDEDGTLIGYGHAKKGRLHGVCREFDRDGNPRAGFPKFYINGKEVTENRFMDAAKTDKVLAETLSHSPPRTEKPPPHNKPASESKGLSVSDARQTP